MSILPASVEAYLQEAGFSVTEIVVLKKLLEEDALTLRELAAKTGKSTGVLDQAVKKLLTKGILSRETINDAPKFVLKSLNTVVAWMEEDMQTRQQMMVRRHQDFETFVRSLTLVKARPEMEYFEGIEGVKKAYMQLLNRGNDIVQYGPTPYLAEEDPLRDFRVQWFRERRNRGLFMRVITHDTVLGRRFQSRDAFEYRKTILVDDEAYPLSFEKIIIGDTIACFQLELERAVFVRYPEMAQEERSFFERLWNKKIQHVRNVSQETDDVTEKAHQKAKNEAYMPVVDVPFATKTLSSLREFFLGRRSIAVLVGLAMLAASLTYGMYLRDVSLNTMRVQERALSIAATGALQFDPEDIEEIQTADDVHKPAYAKLVYQLNLIRSQNPGMKYAYLMRPTGNAMTLEFIADADSLDPSAKKDLNFDGIVDEADALVAPGEQYDVSEIPAMRDAFLGKSTVDPSPHTDQWGAFISGYGPIKDATGKTVALFAADIEARTVQDLSRNLFVLFLTFLGLFLVLLLIRLAAFNRSLFKEICELLRIRKAVIILGVAAAASIAITWGMHAYTQNLMLERMKDKVLAIAVTAAPQFDAKDLQALQVEQDWQKPEWAKVVHQLKHIKMDNTELQYVYFFRKMTSDPTKMEFIADADSINPYANLDDDPTNNVDNNSDGLIQGTATGSDSLVWPGQLYPSPPPEAFNAYHGATTSNGFYEDQWGKVISGYAPIKDSDGNVVAILAVDMSAASQQSFVSESFAPIYVFAIFFVLFVVFRVRGIQSSLLFTLWKKVVTRRVITSAGLLVVILYWIIVGFLSYREHLLKGEIGKRLVAIAATAASQINPDDLENLRFAKDMKSPEYQRIFKQLNEVRRLNPEIVYVYILRPTETDGIWEFVADADANYYIPFDEWDYTGDGKVGESDENVAPGVLLDMAFALPKVYKKGLYNAVFDDSMILNQWGVGLSGSAPIYKDGRPIAVLGIDIENEDTRGLYR